MVGGCRCDRCVQMHQAAMACQLRTPGSVGLKPLLLEVLSDRLNDQLVLATVLVGLQEGIATVALTCGARQGIAAQLSAPQA